MKINNIEYRMVSDPDEPDQEMIDNGYIKVTDAQFDKAFNSYPKLMNNEVTYSDILKEIKILS